ncbi:hypothetical protein B0F90DRAFT_215201 [Multifurca ochricompacta]|uniref:Uncharacterized protein n=1 Tax=Multifurca ochricompacta TaxID=376703 RepID=A0AAD4QP88_9AGAM|nr:hypothetical protein B0F90DRAFT_215201 [Multifurca ochricompacta]
MSPGFTPGVHISPLHQPGVPPFPSPRAHPHSPFHHPMYSHARSPLHHPAHGHPLNATPSGLPPITPSMPSFQFAPGPPSLPHPSHPSIVFSPASTMSPGAFWGRPGGNPLSNAAPGAPVTKSKGDEFDYFAGASAAADEGESYFPQLPQGGSNLAKEILRNEREGISGSGKKPAASGSATEDDVSQEVSTSSVSSGQSSTKERISSTGINGIIERLQSNVHVSLPRTIPRKEEQDRRILSPFGAPPPTRRTGSDPVQGQGQSSSRGGIERRASSAEIVHAADSEQLSGPMHVKIGLRPSE